MLALLHLWRRGRVKFDTWAAAHPWGGLIVGAITVAVLDDAVRGTLSHLFPALSEVVSGTIDRMLPAIFVASGVFLLALAALLTFVMVRAPPLRRSAGPALLPNKAVLTVLILLGCAGIAFLDAHLASSPPRPVSRLDR